MDEDAGEMFDHLEKIASQVRNKDKRRGGEMRDMHHRDRHGIIYKKPPEDVRNVQLNLRVSPRFKRILTTLSLEKGVSATQILVDALYAYREANRK